MPQLDEEILQGNARLPFTSRNAWFCVQQECSDLKRTHAHLRQGTCPKKLTNVTDVKRYLRVASIANDGLLVVRKGARCSSEVDCSLMVRWVVGSILHGVDPFSYFSFQPVLHYWCNKGRGMCYPVSDDAYKRPLLLVGKSSLCGGSGIPFSLSEWSLTICLTHYNRR